MQKHHWLENNGRFLQGSGAWPPCFPLVSDILPVSHHFPVWICSTTTQRMKERSILDVELSLTIIQHLYFVIELTSYWALLKLRFSINLIQSYQKKERKMNLGCLAPNYYYSGQVEKQPSTCWWVLHLNRASIMYHSSKLQSVIQIKFSMLKTSSFRVSTTVSWVI